MKTHLSILALASLVCATASAADFHVFNTNDSGPGSLRQGILSALAHPDDDQRIWFHESFPLDGNVDLLTPLPNLAGKSQIWFLGNARHPRITAPDTGLESILRADQSLGRLMIDDIAFEGGRHAHAGGCIRGTHEQIGQQAVLSIGNSSFTDCGVLPATAQEAKGGAVSWQSPSGEVSIRGTTFRNNSILHIAGGDPPSSGGAVHVEGGTLVVQSSSFQDNFAQTWTARGGAIGTGGALLEMRITDSIFIGNNVSSNGQSEASGGAVATSCLASCEIAMERNYFGQNAAMHGGALYLRRSSAGPSNIGVRLVNNTFDGNDATDFGGALYLGRSDFDLLFNTLERNAATTGANLYLLNGSARTITHNAFGSTRRGIACYFYTLSTSHLTGGHNAFTDDGCPNRLQPGATIFQDLGPTALDLDMAMPVLAYANGSPVIDGGIACTDVDARQQPRPNDGDGDGEARCDIGAYEHRAQSFGIFRDGFEQ